MDTVLKVKNISKSFGSRLVIDDLSFETFGGEVFGFLGPNGAGKTTTIKMILGLLRTDSGEIEICGTPLKGNHEKALSYVGGIVENPETYGFLSGMSNLKQYMRMRKGVTTERLDEVVKLVGMEKRIKDKVKQYSLGMRQRLGLAQAIMHRPKLLILDEPTNGLDPAGIHEFRDTIKKLAKDGTSVLVSSHLLSEMELMCDRVGIICGGKMMGVKTTKELMERASGGQKITRFTVKPYDTAMEVLSGYRIVSSDKTKGSIDIAADSDETVGAITTRLITAGVLLMGASSIERSLEDVFMEVTGGGNQIA
ncbi:MAG: ABC transporter ATP-binding protein [Oscillospiraceae bacterium]|nr:ABC transporter ATP-binding protein [Oscillospiraceae bacterium]